MLPHVLEPVDLLVDRVGRLLGQGELGDLGAVLPDDVVVALAQLLADRSQLLAQEVLALLLVDPFGDIGADLCGDLQFGEVILRPCGDHVDAIADVERGQHRDVLIEIGLTPCRDRIRQLAGLGDGPQDLRQPATAAELGDLLQHDSHLARRRLDTRGRPAVGDQDDLHVIAAAITGMTGHDPGTDFGLDDCRHLPVGHRTGVGDSGHDADVAGRVVVEHHTAVAGAGGLHRGAGSIGRQGEGEDRAREHHRRNDEQRQGELAGVEIGHTC